MDNKRPSNCRKEDMARCDARASRYQFESNRRNRPPPQVNGIVIRTRSNVCTVLYCLPEGVVSHSCWFFELLEYQVGCIMDDGCPWLRGVDLTGQCEYCGGEVLSGSSQIEIAQERQAHPLGVAIMITAD
jgi:hypothetical protein